MIDSTNKEEEEKGEAINDYGESRSSNGGNNDDGDDLVNGKESIPSGEYGKFYQQYLYRLLPAIYQEYDTKKENNVLQEFLKIIASQAAAIRHDIDGLLNNFFINSCEEWVIPYIADLIAARVVPNSSYSRLDVQNAIRWRKLKGTQTGLVDLIRNTINRNANVKEAFRYCSSTSHLAFKKSDVVVNKPHIFVNLHDQNALNDIDTENDITPHTIDVREPTQSSGWYNIKNILLFMPQLNTYHISQVQAEREENRLGYYFSNLVRKQQSSSSSSNSDHFPLYDLDEGVKIRATSFAQDPFKYFGKRRGMSVKIDNILAACPSAPIFSPVQREVNPLENRVTIAATAIAEPNGGNNNNKYDDGYQANYDRDNRGTASNTGDPDFMSLHETEGIRILEPRKFSRSNIPFIIRLYCYPEERRPIEIANYNTSKMSYHRILPRSTLKKIPFGTILISIEVASKIGRAAEFPESVIAIRDSRRKSLVKDNILSKYKNALYVYLPSILVNHDEKKYFFVDRDGSTYEARMSNGRYDKKLRTRPFVCLLASTASSGQIYPPRQLTYSMRPLHNFAELNRFTGIKATDAKRYEGESFVIEAIAINYDKKQAWKIGKLEINSGNGSLSYLNEKEVWIRWRIIVGDTHYNDNYKEYPLPSCHFKATRLDLQNHLEEYSAKIEEIVKSVLPEEIVPEYVLGEKVGTNPDNTYEYEVKIIIENEHREQFEYLANEIRDAIENKPEFINEGRLMLRISKKTTTTRGDFPLSEIILTNDYGISVLVYLPQLKFDKKDKKYYDLYVADDGSTSCEQDFLKHARNSAGQIIPIPNKYPLQHRVPVYANLADWQSVGTTTIYSGELAIDPEHGRFAFSREEDEDDDAQSMHVTADYNYAFSHDIGAGAYDRRASLNKKITKWVSKNRHTSHKDAFPSKIFKTIADALDRAEDDDVIQIEDSGIYDEGDDFTLPPGVRGITLQAANLTMPTIKVNERLKLNSSNSLKRINLDGIAITGGPLALHENFDKIALISCTLNPGYDDNNKRSTNTNISYATQHKSNKASLKGIISLIKSISGGIIVDNSVSVISLEDSIVHNLGGPAIFVRENNKKEKNPTLKLEATRSDILSKYADNYVLELKDICCSNCILTNRVSVKLNEKQEGQTDDDDDDDTSCTSYLRYSRYEQGSTFENIGKGNSAIVDCTIDRPIFISTAFGHPAYLHLDNLSSKRILEGAENNLEMGAFNKSYRPVRMRNLNLRLQEFLPLGVKSGVIYTY
jgi:hypothetical protein